MKAQYRVVVIGGGIVGASVLYHLAKLGWHDVVMIERAELTSGSTWHAAAGCHALNADPYISALQGYTISLYRELEAESGQDVGLRMTGGIALAGSAERWEMLQAEWALFQTLGMDTHLLSPAEIAEICPIVETAGLFGGLYDEKEGRLDPHGVTTAYVKAARARGGDLVLHNRVVELHPVADGSWRVVTEQGTVVAEHVVNAGGLWARRVGRMAGVDLPVVPMQHHYLVTEPIPQIAALDRPLPAVTDMDGFTYLQQERQGLLLGVYERDPRHWQTDGAPWDYGMELIPEDIDRIAGELAIGFHRFPVLAETGIKRWVNGAFTFTPDGNPLLGPVPGLRNFWVACGCMAGFSQGGGMGLALAQWMIEGEPGTDVFGMDVARYGRFASAEGYLRATTAQFYARRFVLTYPNEELPAGRPLKTSPVHPRHVAGGARFTALWGLEVPLYHVPEAPEFAETATLRRSNAHDIVGREVRAVRQAAGLFDIACYARYAVSGPGAEAWLDRLLAGRLPRPGRVRLAPMLSPSGRLMGDLTVLRLAEDRFWLMGSYQLQAWHMRWFADRLPDAGVVLENLSDLWTGVAIAGPSARTILQRLTDEDVSNDGFSFLSVREMDVGLHRAVVGRLSVTGELGYEISVPAAHHLALHDAVVAAGTDSGLLPFGVRALDSLRLEKSYGIWGAEYTHAYTVGASGLDAFVDFEKPAFVGRDAALREREAGPGNRLVTLAIEATNADASGFVPVWRDGRRIGFVTSGGYGHTVGQSLAMAYVEAGSVAHGDQVSVHVVGEERPARVLPGCVHDPQGQRLRR